MTPETLKSYKKDIQKYLNLNWNEVLDEIPEILDILNKPKKDESFCVGNVIVVPTKDYGDGSDCDIISTKNLEIVKKINKLEKEGVVVFVYKKITAEPAYILYLEDDSYSLLEF